MILIVENGKHINLLHLKVELSEIPFSHGIIYKLYASNSVLFFCSPMFSPFECFEHSG